VTSNTRTTQTRRTLRPVASLDGAARPHQTEGVSSHLRLNRLIGLAADHVRAAACPIDDVTAAILTSEPSAEHSARSIANELFDSGEFSEVSGERLIHLPQIFDGTTWAYTLTDIDTATDSLPLEAFSNLGIFLIERDLAIITDDGKPTGESIRWDDVEMKDDEGVWIDDRIVGPPGWLDGGGTVTLTFGPGGTVFVTNLATAPPSTPELDAAFIAAYDACAYTDGPDLRHATTDGVLDELLADHHDLLLDWTVPPISDLAERTGFEIRDHFLAPTGFDWERLDALLDKRRRRLGWHLSDNVDAALDHLLLVVDATARGDLFADVDDPADRSLANTLAVALDLPNLARAFCGELSGASPDAGDEPRTDAALGLLEAVLLHAEQPAGGAALARATLLDHRGEATTALATLEAQVAAGSEHPDALEKLAGFRSDQGDAPAAMTLLRRAGVIHDGVDPETLEDHALFMEIVDFALHRPSATAGRNDPCPCGSGKKYKKCHIGAERHALSDRAVWLYSKATRFARENRFRVLAAELAQEVTQAAGGDHYDFLRFVDLPLVVDLVLSEGGAGEAFASERDGLLPDDEALIAAQWTLVERSVFEVEATTETTLDLRDLRSGDRLTISNTTPSQTTRRGTLLLGRAFPVGDTWRSFAGFVPIAEHLVEQALDALDRRDPLYLAGLIGHTLAPPTLTNTSGDPLEWHTLTWKVADLSTVGPALTAAGCTPEHIADDDDDSDDGARVQVFTLLRDTGQPNTVVANFVLDGDTLTAECNSDQRADEIIELVANHLPDAEFTGHVGDAGEAIRTRLASHGADGLPGNGSPTSDEMREVVAQMVARHEQAWLDESIPALGGMTPRECAANPIARERLERLLARLPDGDDPTQMSATRLRFALGL